SFRRRPGRGPWTAPAGEQSASFSYNSSLYSRKMMCFPSPPRGIPRFAVPPRLRVCRRKLCVTMIIHHVSLHFNQKSVRPSKNFCSTKQFQDKMKRPPLPCMGAGVVYDGILLADDGAGAAGDAVPGLLQQGDEGLPPGLGLGELH